MSEIKFQLDADGRPACSGTCPIYGTCAHAKPLGVGGSTVGPCYPGILETEGKVGDFKVEIDGIEKTISVPANISACELNDVFEAHGIDTHRVYTVTPADALLARIARLEGVEELLVAERAKTAAWKEWLGHVREYYGGVIQFGSDGKHGASTWDHIAKDYPWPSLEEEKAEAVEDSDTSNVDDD